MPQNHRNTKGIYFLWFSVSLAYQLYLNSFLSVIQNNKCNDVDQNDGKRNGYEPMIR